jgi:hypothetical protein
MWARERTVSRKPKFNSSFLVLWDFNIRQRWEWNKQGEMKQKRKEVNKPKKKSIILVWKCS